MGGFDQLFRTLQSIPVAADRAIQKGLKRGAVIVMKRAKAKLGTYQEASGSFKSWALLKPETVRRKHLSKSGSGKLTRAGKAYLKKHGAWGAGGDDDSPLVYTGHLRQAITTDFTDIEHGVAYVGVGSGSTKSGVASPSDYAATHEFGTFHVPARPYLRPALEESREEIKEAVAQALIEEMRRFK
jgi:HK97 gp10 family phage protein